MAAMLTVLVRPPCQHAPSIRHANINGAPNPCPYVAVMRANTKATLTEQAPDSSVLTFLTDGTAAHVHAAFTADRGVAAAAAGAAAGQQRTAADADAAMTALLVGALITAHHCPRNQARGADVCAAHGAIL